MFHNAPETIVGKTSLCNKTMDVRIPFKRSAECVKDTDKSRDKIFGFIDFVKHVHNNAADSLKQAVKKVAVFQKERSKFFIDSENTVSVVH